MVGEIVLVQHAEKERRRGDPGLTTLGTRQARDVAARLAAEEWDLLLSSPLLRARQTAAPIAAACGLAVDVDARLRERMGWGEGDDSESIDAFLADWERATRERDWTPPSGASSLATGRRMEQVLADLTTAPGTRALAVTHGGATVDLLRNLVPDATLEAQAPGVIADGVPACRLTHLVHDGVWTVRAIAVATLAG